MEELFYPKSNTSERFFDFKPCFFEVNIEKIAIILENRWIILYIEGSM